MLSKLGSNIENEHASWTPASDEPEGDSAIETGDISENVTTAVLPEIGSHLLPNGQKKTHKHNLSLVSNISTLSALSLLSIGEEFEDYGEGDVTDLSMEEAPPLQLADPLVSGKTSLQHRNWTSHEDGCVDGHLMSEALSFCSGCSRHLEQLGQLENRLHRLETTSPNKRMLSMAYARQLLQGRNGSFENLGPDCLDSAEPDIEEKLSTLERKVSELESDSVESEGIQNRLAHENKQLVLRTHELEEQLKEQESGAEEIALEEERKHRETLLKFERDASEKASSMTSRIQQLDDDNAELSLSVGYLKVHTQKLEETNQDLLGRLEGLARRLQDDARHTKELSEMLHRTRQSHQQDKETTQEVIEGLRRELEQLQLLRHETSRARRRFSSSGEIGRPHDLEFENEVQRLKQELRRFKEQNEDLHGQIIGFSIQEAKSLCSTTPRFQSLAAEIDSASKDEVMEALREQEEINCRLRQYMDKIILSILDTNPSILEIKA
uniref:rab11 family-interacting protein 4-like isoform X1 n=2 Tax=Myxine glutinosa TaxID=7769 RepID=UPI00358DE4DE